MDLRMLSQYKILMGMTVEQRNKLIWVSVNNPSDRAESELLMRPLCPAGPQPPPPPPTVGPRKRQPLPGCLVLKSSVQCDACARIIAHGSVLDCSDMSYPYYKTYPIKHYVNCPNCSAEMMIETVKGKSGFKSLVGATEYSGPVDERNKVTVGPPPKMVKPAGPEKIYPCKK